MKKLPSYEEIKDAILTVAEWAYRETYMLGEPEYYNNCYHNGDAWDPCEDCTKANQKTNEINLAIFEEKLYNTAKDAPELPKWAFACALFAELPITKVEQELILKAGNLLPKSDISGRDIANYYKSQITDFEALEAWERELIGR